MRDICGMRASGAVQPPGAHAWAHPEPLLTVRHCPPARQESGLRWLSLAGGWGSQCIRLCPRLQPAGGGGGGRGSCWSTPAGPPGPNDGRARARVTERGPTNARQDEHCKGPAQGGVHGVPRHDPGRADRGGGYGGGNGGGCDGGYDVGGRDDAVPAVDPWGRWVGPCAEASL
eukprot:gene16701-biopygen759